MTVGSGLTARSGLMVIKHSSVRSYQKTDQIGYCVLIGCFQSTKQNKYSKVLWPCGFIPCFRSSRQFYFCHIIIYFVYVSLVLVWLSGLWFILYFTIKYRSVIATFRTQWLLRIAPTIIKKIYLEDQSLFLCIIHYYLNTETDTARLNITYL